MERPGGAVRHCTICRTGSPTLGGGPRLAQPGHGQHAGPGRLRARARPDRVQRLRAAAADRAHFNLANYLARSGQEATSIVHRLAASVLRAITGAGSYRDRLPALARQLGAGTPPPQSFDALCASVEQVDGVGFRALVKRLGGDGDEVMARVLEEARSVPPQELYASQLATWEPTLPLLVAAAAGNAHARAHLDARLAGRSEQADWVDLAGRLGRVCDGERDAGALTDGLNPIETLVVTRALDALGGRVSLEPTPEPLRPLIHAVVAISAARRRGATPSAEEQEVAGRVEADLVQLEATEDWAVLATQLRQLTTGATQVEWEGLDAIDTAILATVLRRLDAASHPQEPRSAGS